MARGENTQTQQAHRESSDGGISNHLAAGATGTVLIFHDSPGIRIVNGRHFLDLSADAYLVFRPDGENSTWIAQQVMRWRVGR